MFKYLLLNEFEVHTASYGLSFCVLIYGPSTALHAGRKSTGKKQRSVNEVSKIFTEVNQAHRKGNYNFQI